MAISQSLNNGIKQIINNVASKSLNENSQSHIDYKVFSGYKNLKDTLRLRGILNLEVATAPTANTNYTIEYKADHYYRLIQDFLLKLNANINVKQWNDLSFCRIFQVYENIGELPYCNAPTSITIAANQTKGSANFEILIPVWFMMPDMIGATQSFILTMLYSTMQAQFKVNTATGIISSVKQGNTTLTLQGNNAQANLSFSNITLDSASDFWIVRDDYLKSSTKDEVLQKMGMIYETSTIAHTFTANGQNQYIELMPTTEKILKDIFIVCRDAVTGKRVDNVFKNIKISDGDRPLVDVNPIFLREQANERYNLSWDLYDAVNPNSPDGQGYLYGVHRIDASYFGELQNALLATGDWRQPYLWLDIENIETETQDRQLLVDVYQSFCSVPASIQAQANAYVAQQRSV